MSRPQQLSASALPFNGTVISSFKLSKRLKNHKADTSITSLDFDDTGVYCLSAGEDESIQLYDCRTGKHNKTIYSKKYGVGLARFTHNSMNCIYSSTKEDDTIRYLSLHDNHYIRYLRGHKGRVISCELSPVDDTVISAGMDNSVRLWDLRSSSPQGLLNIVSPSLVAFDSTGMVFAVASQLSQTISLYDTKKYYNSPFLVIKTPEIARSANWVKIELSNDGKLLMVTTDSDGMYIYNSYDRTYLAKLDGHETLPRRNSAALPSHTCFSIDGKYVFGASGDNRICVWDTSQIDNNKQGQLISPSYSLECPSENAYVLAFSPRTMLLATANTSLSLWMPDRTSL